MVEETPKPVCGLVMPISAIDGLSEAHWSDVKAILEETIVGAGFVPRLVSHANEVGIIQQRIVQNLYENPIVVVDVSAKNPNVMFELGMRLTFDKPTVIVKDDKTNYSFDTAPIDHLGYPRDLRFGKITEFKAELAARIKATYEASQDPNYTTFLKHFQILNISKLDKREVSSEQFILEELKALRVLVEQLPRSVSNPEVPDRQFMSFNLSALTPEQSAEFRKRVVEIPGVSPFATGISGLSVTYTEASNRPLLELVSSMLDQGAPVRIVR
jgi:hypothetical protein